MFGKLTHDGTICCKIQIMNYYVFQAADQSSYVRQRTGQETFDFLVKEKSAWGFGHNTPNRKAVQTGDKALFYLTGTDNQVFIGAATLKSGAYEDTSGESKDWYLDPKTLRIDLENIVVFPEPKPRKNFKGIDWRPVQGGCNKISERDYMVIVGMQPDIAARKESTEEMEFALERYLEDFIVDNWDKIDFGEKLDIFEDDDGNKGKQYYAEEIGYIDILATDRKGNFVVIELKKGRKNDEVIGQVLRYMGWVRENLARGNKNVRGLVIVREKDQKLEYALKEIAGKVDVLTYWVEFGLRK